jgi:D-tagatose-1,6-bisphosphate aldolase subunit GatZ/KbaZ
MRLYSRLDRIRYYWGHPRAQAALERLHRNLAPAVPADLVERHFPDHRTLLAPGEAAVGPAELVGRRIRTVLAPYRQACR